VNDSVSAAEIDVPVNAGTLVGCMHYSSALQNGVTGKVSGRVLQVELPAEEIGIFQAQR
jgi:hypothetical protein